MTTATTLKYLIFEHIGIKINNILLNEKSNKNQPNNIIEIDLNENYSKELYQYLFKKEKVKIEFEEMKKIIRKINVESIFDILSLLSYAIIINNL